MYQKCLICDGTGLVDKFPFVCITCKGSGWFWLNIKLLDPCRLMEIAESVDSYG
jgi:hypothetical protein